LGGAVLDVGDGHRRRGEVGVVDVGHGNAAVDDDRAGVLGEGGAAGGGGHRRRVVDRRHRYRLVAVVAVAGAVVDDEAHHAVGRRGRILVGVVVGHRLQAGLV